ncbi:MAG: bifunctional phosphoglucose/phosphomannose isomerase [Candidatus Acetothermia bacterium]
MAEIDDINYEELDKQGMLDDLENFPSQVREGFEIGRGTELPYDLCSFRRLVVTGMGGSAIIGDLLARLLGIEVVVNRGYYLPSRISPERDLLIAVSYSGNTEETLSALEDGLRRGLPVLGLSTGGQMEEFCSRRNVPLIKIPSGGQPRASTGYMLFPLIELSSRGGLIADFDFPGFCDRLEELEQNWRRSSPSSGNLAKGLAQELKGRIPLIYGTAGNTGPVAYRWKTQFNENSKQPAFYNTFPELNHNEAVGFELVEKLPFQPYVLLLKNGLEYERNALRLRIMGKIFEERGIEHQVVEAPSGDTFARILGQLYLGDFVSTYLGLLNGEDPSPVALIERFKRLLAEERDADCKDQR